MLQNGRSSGTIIIKVGFAFSFLYCDLGHTWSEKEGESKFKMWREKWEERKHGNVILKSTGEKWCKDLYNKEEWFETWGNINGMGVFVF